MGRKSKAQERLDFDKFRDRSSMKPTEVRRAHDNFNWKALEDPEDSEDKIEGCITKEQFDRLMQLAGEKE